MQGDRPQQHDPDILRSLGLGITPEGRNSNPLANFGITRAANSNYNPNYATGCNSPASLPTLGNASLGTPTAAPVYAPGCYRNPLYFNAVTGICGARWRRACVSWVPVSPGITSSVITAAKRCGSAFSACKAAPASV